jgi:secondary thiamine-phosphate synthase enzyme
MTKARSSKWEWELNPHSCSGYLGHEVQAHVQKSEFIHHTEYLFVQTPKRYALVSVHDQVSEALKRSKVQDGFCFVSAMHITAGIYVNDAESGLLNDISHWIENLAPYGEDYRHHQTGEDNGDAHLKSFLTNHSVTVPVTKARLDLGTWQHLFYAEFDGKRKKRILVKITGLATS